LDTSDSLDADRREHGFTPRKSHTGCRCGATLRPAEGADTDGSPRTAHRQDHQRFPSDRHSPVFREVLRRAAQGGPRRIPERFRRQRQRVAARRGCRLYCFGDLRNKWRLSSRPSTVRPSVITWSTSQPDPGWRPRVLQRVSRVISNVASAGGSVLHANRSGVVAQQALLLCRRYQRL